MINTNFINSLDLSYTQKFDSPIIQKIQNNYKALCSQVQDKTVHKEYCELQMTWNYQVLTETLPFLKDSTEQSALSLGSFLAIMEMSLADVFSKIICVDQKNYIPEFAPKNIEYYEADLDSGNWVLPKGDFKICYMIEILEHLLWSPIPLLKQLSKQVQYLAITTPDDREWPEMPIKPYIRYQHYSAIPSSYPGCVGNPEPMFHCKQYSQAEFIELLSFAGFRLISFSRVGCGGHQMFAICESIR